MPLGARLLSLGIVIALVAAVGMPVLARIKLRLANLIGSRALRADAMETLTCGYLAWVLLAGLATNALLHEAFGYERSPADPNLRRSLSRSKTRGSIRKSV